MSAIWNRFNPAANELNSLEVAQVYTFISKGHPARALENHVIGVLKKALGPDAVLNRSVKQTPILSKQQRSFVDTFVLEVLDWVERRGLSA